MGMNFTGFTKFSRIVRTAVLGAFLTMLLTGGSAGAVAAAPTAPATTAVGSVCYSALPPEAHDTLRLIARGGPYPYPQDGGTFYNREGLLPSQPTGYYREYTVKTPGVDHRGARRIVTGDSYREDYYTADHYASFRLINYGC
jgi:ribonuclease T1